MLNDQITISYKLLTLSIAVFLVILVVLIVFIYKSKTQLNLTSYYLDIIRSVSKALSNNHEIVAFNDEDDIIYTTHPTSYSNKEEFFRELISKVNASDNLQNFYNFFEKRQNYVTTLSGSGSGLYNQFKKWIVDVSFLEDSDSLINENISVVTLTEATKQFADFNKVLNNYEKIENILDNFPLGIFYLNNKGIIIGSNITFANQLNAPREKLIGVNIKEFITDFDYNQATRVPCKITISPKFSRDFKASLIKSNNQKSSIQPWILIKESLTDNEQPPEDYANKNVFYMSVIPSIIVHKNGEVKAINSAFSSMIQDKVVIDKNKILTKKFSLSEFVINSNEIIDRLYSKNNESIEIKLLDGNTTAVAYISEINDDAAESQYLIQLIDISSQKILEQQFVQSQKIQAVGQLAGGIAHDFNNLLTAMIGFCDLLLQRHTINDPSYGDIIQIKQSAGRAANLVRQLLAFSKQQTLMPKVVSITDVLTDLASLLKRLVGVNIDFQIIHGRDIWPVKVDINQFEQVIMNLVINARDAMRGSGVLKVKTKNYFSDKEFKCVYDIAPSGDYVLIEVIDDGCGIKPELIEKIFEPFYSNKDEKIKALSGSGTGLGLATVYGIVNQTGGFIAVDTELGKGTNFKIYLPRYQGQEVVNKVDSDQKIKDLAGSETILLVEDEEPVRLFSSRALRDKGYKVLEAASGEEALKIAENERFDLLITDVVMPKIDGPTLNKTLRQSNQGFKTLFISGYAKDTFREDIGKNSKIHFLQKPFTLKDLTIKIKEIMYDK